MDKQRDKCGKLTGIDTLSRQVHRWKKRDKCSKITGGWMNRVKGLADKYIDGQWEGQMYVSKLLVDKCANKETDGKIDKCIKITRQTDKGSTIDGW